MKSKVIVWGFGIIVTASGLLWGLRGAARAIGIESYQITRPEHSDQRRICHTPAPDDAYSPDAFREELLK